MDQKEILFVVGDVGAGNVVLALLSYLEENHCNLTFALDNKGKAKDLFCRGDDVIITGSAELIGQEIEAADLVVIGMSASAVGLEKDTLIKALNMGKPIVILSDGPYNIGLPCWRELHNVCALADIYFLAINKAHVTLVKKTWPQLRNIYVMGQPALDKAISMIPDKQKTRRQVRRKLHLDGKTVLLWFAEGMREVAVEDFFLFERAMHSLAGLRDVGLRQFKKPVVIPALHPKLDHETSMDQGYRARIFAEIQTLGETLQIEVLERPTCLEEELILAADIIASPLGTSAAKAEAMGMQWPVIVHWAAQDITTWYQDFFGIKGTHELIDVMAGRALALDFRGQSDVARVMHNAMKYRTAQKLLRNWVKPSLEPAAMHIAARVLQIIEENHYFLHSTVTPSAR